MNFALKRYVITIAFIVITTLCIGTFYIQADGHRYPEYTLVKQQGDENEAKDVFLRGIYNRNNHIRMSPGVTIGIEGSQYTSDLPLMGRIDSYYYSGEEVKKLVKEHRHFMRGKKGGSNYSFYQDDDLLVYVNVKSDFTSQVGSTNFRFIVDVLDKKGNNSWSYKVSLSESHLYQFINLYDVQVYGDEIIVLTRNHIRNNNDSNYHRYSLSLNSDNKMKPTDHVIEFPFSENSTETSDHETSGEAEKTNSNIGIIFDSSLTGSSRYHVFFAAERRNVDRKDLTTSSETSNNKDVDVSYQEIVSAQIMIYDLQTAQWVEVNIPEIIEFLDIPFNAESLNMKLEGNYLYLTKLSDQGVSVIEYGILSEKVTMYNVDEESVIFSEVQDDRIYMLTETYNDGSKQTVLTIADLESGERVYQGSIEVSGSESSEPDVFNRLDMNQIIIK